MKEKSLLQKVTSKTVVLGLQLVATGIFLYFIFKLDLVPLHYLLTIGAGLIVLLGLYYFVLYLCNKKKEEEGQFRKRILATKVISVLTSIVLLIGTIYSIRSNQFISNISEATDETYIVSVIVLKDSSVKKLANLNGQTFGISYQQDSKIIAEAVASFEKELGSSQDLDTIETYVLLAEQLYDESVDAIIVGEEYRSMLEANHEHFGVETKVVATYKVKKEKETTTVPTNVTQEPFTIYLTGIDSYGDDVSVVSRSDVNLIVTVHPQTKQILMVSIPRDTEITLASNNKMDKLTHVGSLGSKESFATIEKFLDIEINYYGKTNFSGVVDIIDALDGVVVDSPNAFTTMHGGFEITKGINELNGLEALGFVRERYDLPRGDFDRGKNQQLLLAAMLKKAMSPTIITNFNSILSAIEGTFETDMASDDIKSLLNMQLNDMASWDISNVQVSGSGYKTTETYAMRGTEVYVMKPNATSIKRIKALIDKVQEGQILSEEDTEGLYE